MSRILKSGIVTIAACALWIGVAGELCSSLDGSANGGIAFAGEEKRKKCVEAADVYFGDAKKWDKPAEVDPDLVYAKIDEYKEIVDNGYKPGDPKYEILMAKASKRFTAAVKKTAKDGGYDLVARVGCVKGCDAVPNITADVIANL